MKPARFVWWTDEDVEIVGDQICSKCLGDIPEDEVPLMCFHEHVVGIRKGKVDIARFHEACAREYIEAGIIALAPSPA